MNARDYKIFRIGNYYHVYNRGNNKEVIFKDDQDYLNFLKRLKLALGFSVMSSLRISPVPSGSFTVICYCLMPNHFHFIIRQDSDVGVDRLISRVCTSYSKYFNKKYSRVGHVFQDTFKAKIIETDQYFMYLSAYIHHNPDDPAHYIFSSFPDYLGVRRGEICDKTKLLGMFENKFAKYKDFVLNFSEREASVIKNLLFED